MEITELLSWLTDGLDDAEKAVVSKAVMRDTVKSKASGLKAQSEFDRIYNERMALQQELEGDAATGKLSARATREWYEKNSPAVLANDKAIRDFEAKYGQGSFAKAAAGELPQVTPPPTTTNPPATGMLTEDQINKLIEARIASGVKPAAAKEDIEKMVDARIQGAYAPKWSELLTDTGTIVQKHMYAKRTAPIDFKKLSEIAQTKNIPLEAAYDEWDKPEREKLAKEQMEAEIERRVAEGIQKRGAVTEFPAGADAGPSSLERKPDAEKFDKRALMNQMLADVKAIQ